MSTNEPLSEVDISLRKQAGIALHRTLVENQSMPSCLNCAHFEPTNELCIKFDRHPPAEVIVFSCGVKDWEGSIPF